MKFLTRVMFITSLTISLIFTFLFYLESFNYDNYVYSTLHINLARFAIVPGVFWTIYFYYYLRSKKVSSITILLTSLFCLVSLPVLIQSTGSVLARTHQILLGKSYVVQKAEAKIFGDDLKFIKFVKDYIGENSKIIVILPPDRLPWRHTGNTQIMNSLLYPIQTTNNLDAAANYILISSEEDGAPYHLWPDYKIPAKEIIIYDWQNDEGSIISGKDWDPTQWQDLKPWGLIIRNENE